MILLDTNVVSEPTRQRPDPAVLTFLAGLPDAFISVVTLHELRFGLLMLPEGQRRSALEQQIGKIGREFSDSILPVGQAEAELAATFRASAQSSGRVLHLADALIAASAQSNSLALATRNTSDFIGLGLRLVDPWTTR